MSSSSSKENSRTLTLSSSHTLSSTGRLPQMAAIPDPSNLMDSPAASEHMLSPPPEEELRHVRRPTNEPSSASRPLANRSNRQSTSEAQHSTPIPKRKRTVTQTHNSPNILFDFGDTSQTTRTPNPRLRKQVRQAPDSPSPAPSSSHLDHVRTRASRSPTPRTPRQDDIMCSPTRKGKSRCTPRSLVPKSPHGDNPNANYIPPTQLYVDENKAVGYRRRSVTPMPPYEPPLERFTPPREIVISPTVANDKKTSTTRTVTKKKRNSGKTEKAPLHMRIKTEPPEIDLSPAPPASPGDDPILLIGPPQPSKPKQRREGDSSHIIDVEMDLELPEHERRSLFDDPRPIAGPSRGHMSSSVPPAFDFSNLNDDAGDMNMCWTDDTSSDAHFDNPVQDNIDAGRTVDNWSESEPDDENKKESVSMGEGDFTGKFVAYFSPIRRDPPTSATRERMEEWGRPISPHPRVLSFTEPKEEDDSDAIMNQAVANGAFEENIHEEDNSDEDDETQDATPSRSTYADRKGRRLTLSELEKIKFGNSKDDQQNELQATEDADSSDDDSPLENADYSRLDIENGNPSDVDLDSSNSPSNRFKSSGKRLGASARPSNMNVTRGRSGVEGRRSEEETSQGTLVNNENSVLKSLTASNPLSHELRQRTKPLPTSTQHGFLMRKPEEPVESEASDAETELEETDDADDETDESGVDLSVVKIMSEDPMAAARAAAILKMHDYDMVARKLRRRKTAHGSIGKAYKAPKASQLWRRRTVAGLSAEAELAANVSLPELLDKAETELRDTPSRSRSASLAVSASSQKDRLPNTLYPDADADGIREWTKADWKLLDSCFTDERYEVGEEQGIDGERAPVDDIQLENVVDRFVDLMGGLDKVLGHGPSWSIEKILNRTKVLCKRQRTGEGAPPTPDVSSRFASPSRFRTLSPSSSMIMPDFTPQGPERIRDFGTGAVSRKVSLPPPSSEPFFKVPTIPLRFSNLRHSATPPVDVTPRMSRAKDLFGFETPARRNEEDSDDESVALEVEDLLTPVRAERMRQAQQNPRPPSTVRRSLSFISSWLKPDTFKTKEEKKVAQRPGLPVPPPDVLALPRGPVETPLPRPLEKAIPHKELVDLDHVDIPPEAKIQEKPEPKRLVDLNHVPTPAPKESKRMSRRSSTSSVKDLVKEFEAKERAKVQALPSRVKELRKQGGLNTKKAKPAWR